MNIVFQFVKALGHNVNFSKKLFKIVSVLCVEKSNNNNLKYNLMYFYTSYFDVNQFKIYETYVFNKYQS